MKRFVIGTVLGAILMYGFIHHGPEWMRSSETWLDDTAGGYRGDSRRRMADEALR